MMSSNKYSPEFLGRAFSPQLLAERLKAWRTTRQPEQRKQESNLPCTSRSHWIPDA